MTTWDCPCGITNPIKKSVCTGCGWTKTKADSYKSGEVIQISEAENRKIALRTYEKESRFATVLALSSVVGIFTLIVLGFCLGSGAGDGIFAVFVFLFLVCLFVLGFAIFITAGLREQYKHYDELPSVESEECNGQVRDQEEPRHELLVAKIRPTSGLNLKRRIVGFLFGASMPISYVIFEHVTWKYVAMTAFAFGVVGFILGDKYYDKITKIMASIRRKS